MRDAALGEKRDKGRRWRNRKPLLAPSGVGPEHDS